MAGKRTAELLTAYDYQAQQWVHGDRARRVRRAQVEEEIALLSGPKADDYARMIGLPSVPEALARLRQELRRLVGLLERIREKRRALDP